jgi:hypothetical protein
MIFYVGVLCQQANGSHAASQTAARNSPPCQQATGSEKKKIRARSRTMRLMVIFQDPKKKDSCPQPNDAIDGDIFRNHIRFTHWVAGRRSPGSSYQCGHLAVQCCHLAVQCRHLAFW